MVESDGKLTDVNFFTRRKNPSAADGRPDGKADGKPRKRKNRPIRPVQLRCRGQVPLRR